METGLQRKICVVTGTRAEYGLLKPLLRQIELDSRMQLQLVVTGSHLSKEYGYTANEIVADGFKIAEKVEISSLSRSGVEIAGAMADVMRGLGLSFSSLRPDIVVILGDRFEILAAAIAAQLLSIPVAHLHGGELSEGAYDEAFRHAITKLSNFHFTAAKAYGERVIQLGEDPANVKWFGSPGLDEIGKLTLQSRIELELSLGFELGDKFFLVTYHPVTREPGSAERNVKSLLSALDDFPDYKVLTTYPNIDAESNRITKIFREYEAANTGRVCLVESLGRLRYLSAASLSAAVVGNSSSGLIEVPLLRRPTVNIGSRQQGRLRASSVVDCDDSAIAIKAGLIKAISPVFLAEIEHMTSPYLADGNASENTKNFLRDVSLEDVLVKKFYDIRQGQNS